MATRVVGKLHMILHICIHLEASLSKSYNTASERKSYEDRDDQQSRGRETTLSDL